jgi:hypothetical protein
MVTATVSADLMLEAAGVTVTVGVVGLLPNPPPPLLLPPPQDSIERIIAISGNNGNSYANRFIRTFLEAFFMN